MKSRLERVFFPFSQIAYFASSSPAFGYLFSSVVNYTHKSLAVSSSRKETGLGKRREKTQSLMAKDSVLSR